MAQPHIGPNVHFNRDSAAHIYLLACYLVGEHELKKVLGCPRAFRISSNNLLTKHQKSGENSNKYDAQ
jgi:hypothetical protein